MSHEMTRADARAAGYDVDDLPATIPAATRDDDVVNVWDQLPDAESFVPEQPDRERVQVGSDPPPADPALDDIFATPVDLAIDGDLAHDTVEAARRRGATA